MDLNTHYLGLLLRSPLVASASPLTTSLDDVRTAVDGGLGAVVMYSLFEEQIRAQELHDYRLTTTSTDCFGEADRGYFTATPGDVPTAATTGSAPYLRQLERIAGAVEVPVIASLNGSTVGGWTQTAAQLESAGAAAIELNIYAVPGDALLTGPMVELAHLEILTAVKSVVSVPVAVKLSPFFSSTSAMALALADEGADGLVLFNRFMQPDIDLERLAVVPGATLSTSAEARLPRTWIALLRRQLNCSLAATTGVETGDDVAAYLLAGADVVMTASALLRHGPSYAATLREQLESWLQRKGFASSDGVRGLLAVPPGEAAETQRAGYVAALRKAQGSYGSLQFS